MLKNRSISFKFVLLFLLTAVAMAIVLRFSSGGVFVKQFQDMVRPHLYQYFQYINKEIGNPPNLETAQHLSDSLHIKIIINGPDLHWSSDGIFPNKRKIHLEGFRGSERKYQSGRYKRNLVIRIPNRPYHTVFITKNDSQLPSPWKLLLNTLLGVLLVLGILYFILRKMISPLKDIQKSVKRIGAGELDHRITIKRNDEFGLLSNEINSMADDIENMLEAKRQLLLAISHELRSPITRAKVATSLMKSSNLKEGLESDLNEMETMVAGLLEAEQLNHRHQTLNLNKVVINLLIPDLISKYFPTEKINQELENNSNKLSVDEARIQFVIKNLLSNALKYKTYENDPVTIISKYEKKHWILIVEDQGKGIPEKDLPHISEPFYRVDPSRHRETGGYGLGLYIIKMIVEAHKGKLLIESEEGSGTKVTVIIPFI